MTAHMLKEIDNLKRMLLYLSTSVEENVFKAVKALDTRDTALAERIIAADQDTDRVEVNIEEECLKVLALHQPVAIDLRLVVTVLKINNDLERIGDESVNIAERTLFLNTQPPLDVPLDFKGMAEKTKTMLKNSLTAFVNLDTKLARDVCAADDEVDAINREMYAHIKAAIRRDPSQVDSLLHLVSISRHLERIADHATNIAEDVIYMVAGEIVRHHAEDYRPPQGKPA
ncbi:MAG: phosphate signaling complex protein PhoU [Candidatus Lambdaproteobacteria bacterium]|nr:phosphate signaling complex protein PhoU [Candidatus Lambdaproteobacteria bacterium]